MPYNELGFTVTLDNKTLQKYLGTIRANVSKKVENKFTHKTKTIMITSNYSISHPLVRGGGVKWTQPQKTTFLVKFSDKYLTIDKVP